MIGKRRPRGIIAAIATPITAAGDPDHARFVTLARHLLANGCDGLNVLGTTGEATSFSVAQRTGLMRAMASADLDLSGMMVGTGAASVGDAVALTREAANLGFGGALVLPPFYYKGVHDDGVVRYIERLVESTTGSAILIYLYNFPALSGVPYSVPLVRRLVETFGDRIAGLKDSSGDLAYARSIAALSPTLDVFPSSESSLAEARRGPFAGCISATANVNAAFCANALHREDDTALATATRIRELFSGKALVPAIKAVLASIHADPALADVLPPLCGTGTGESHDLIMAYRQIVDSADAGAALT